MTEERYPNGRFGTPEMPELRVVSIDAELEDDDRWQAEEDAEYGPATIAAELTSRETSAPRTVEPDSIDAASLAHADRPSAAESHAADQREQLGRALGRVAELEHTVVEMAGLLADNDAERRDRAAQTERPRQHGRIVSLILALAGDR